MQESKGWNLNFAKGLLSASKAPLLGLTVLWLCALIIAVVGLGDLPLRDFDEGTVARVAFELSQKKGIEQLFPTLWGTDYINKPPGLHWLIAAFIHHPEDQFGSLAFLPSDFQIRLVPALLSTLVVPLGGLIQWRLRPQDPISSLATAGILLTLLPVARHGRLAMLDGSQLSFVALFWLIVVGIDKANFQKSHIFFAGLVSSCLLLLKAPFLLPTAFAALIPIVWGRRVQYRSMFSIAIVYTLGLIPGIVWHVWHFLQRGGEALWLWGGDGAGRVLFQSGEGSDLGVFVPLIELLEGGWPWLLLLPFGFFLAWKERYTKWGQWAIGTQGVLMCAILPLKTQLPWYSHPLWLPFALVCGPPLSWLIQRNFSKCMPAQVVLSRVPYLWMLLGISLQVFAFLGFSDWVKYFRPFSGIAFVMGVGWLIGGWLLTRALLRQRIMGFIALLSGSFVGLLIFMGSPYWLWELNESWAVGPVAEMISNYGGNQIFIHGDNQRPSLNWYAQKEIKTIESFSTSAWVLTRNPSNLEKESLGKDCQLVQEEQQWALMFCKNK